MTIQATNNSGVILGLALTTSLLSGCGGGGGAAYQYDYTQGTPSSEASADSAINNNSLSSLPYVAPDGTSYSSLLSAKSSLNNNGDAVATVDTNARAAWRQGWTGNGVKVGIADSFNSNGVLDSHGDWVAIVQSSVAPEATIGTRDVLSSSTLVGLLGNVNSAYSYFEDNGYHIINNSWGIDRMVRTSSGAYTNVEHSDFDSLVDATVAAFDPNAPGSAQGLYIMAAGNGGQFCPTKRVENCNWIGAVTDKLRDRGYASGSRLIFVGSLEDNSDNIASYSYVAGDLKNDFIVAHDDILGPGDGAGTSFAAPRISGAAALTRQKFPNLTSAQLKQVLLQTADDLGSPGVDAVYGHGKLNVLNALSPQGTVVPR